MAAHLIMRWCLSIASTHCVQSIRVKIAALASTMAAMNTRAGYNCRWRAQCSQTLRCTKSSSLTAVFIIPVAVPLRRRRWPGTRPRRGQHQIHRAEPRLESAPRDLSVKDAMATSNSAVAVKTRGDPFESASRTQRTVKRSPSCLGKVRRRPTRNGSEANNTPFSEKPAVCIIQVGNHESRTSFRIRSSRRQKQSATTARSKESPPGHGPFVACRASFSISSQFLCRY